MHVVKSCCRHYLRLTLCTANSGLAPAHRATLIPDRPMWHMSVDALCSRSKNWEWFFDTGVKTKNEPGGVIEIIDHGEFYWSLFTSIDLVLFSGFSLDDLANASDFDLNTAQVTYKVTCSIPWHSEDEIRTGKYSPDFNCRFGVLSPWSLNVPSVWFADEPEALLDIARFLSR